MSAVIKFAEDLFDSILTPGATPTLVRATHATFAALVVILSSLLIATHNIHFLIMLLLASGLWAALGWFLNEVDSLKASQQHDGHKVIQTDNSTSATTQTSVGSAKPKPRKTSRKI